MTKTELEGLVNHYGADNLVGIVFDNSLVVYFLGDETFDPNCIKTVGGMDVIELKNHSYCNKTTGRYDIPCISVHPIDMVQYVSFVNSPEEKRNIDPRGFQVP